MSDAPPVPIEVQSPATNEPRVQSVSLPAPQSDTLTSPRSTEFHMTSIIPPPTVQAADDFNILSPTSSAFPKQPFLSTPSPPRARSSSPSTMKHGKRRPPPFTSQNRSPSPPRRAAPPPPVPVPEIRMQSLDGIFSPTHSDFVLPPLQPFTPLSLDKSSPRSSLDVTYLLDKQAAERQSARFDSLVPTDTTEKDPPTTFPTRSSSIASRTQPLALRDWTLSSTHLGDRKVSPPRSLSTSRSPSRLRKKFSAPNLSERIRLQQLQKEIASSLPQRPAEAGEVLMSPRTENFAAPIFNLQRIQESSSSPIQSPGVDGASSGGSNGQMRDQFALHLAPDQALQSVENSGSELSTPRSGSPQSDPRSPPATMGISPITRNIWGMI